MMIGNFSRLILERILLLANDLALDCGVEVFRLLLEAADPYFDSRHAKILSAL